MKPNRKLPEAPLEFIRRCLDDGRVYWTYHVNMRLATRRIGRGDVRRAARHLVLVESYPEDRYMPSFLLLAQDHPGPFHLVCAADVEGGNIRIITVYRPDPAEWADDMTTRRTT